MSILTGFNLAAIVNYLQFQLLVYFFLYCIHHIHRRQNCQSNLSAPLSSIAKKLAPFWLFEHSSSMTLCTCLWVLVLLCCTACAWWEPVHGYNTVVAALVDMYQAALTNMHVCRLCIYICELFNENKTENGLQYLDFATKQVLGLSKCLKVVFSKWKSQVCFGTFTCLPFFAVTESRTVGSFQKTSNSYFELIPGLFSSFWLKNKLVIEISTHRNSP